MIEQKDFNFDDVGWGLGWAFWIQWVIANAVSWNLAMILRQVLFEAGAINQRQIAIGLAIGFTVGIGQWLILLQQPYLTGWRWVLMNTAGWAVGWAVGWQFGWQLFGSMGFGVVFAVIGGTAGLLAGLGQWFTLRNQVYGSGWWIVANTMAWSIGLAITFTLGRQLGWAITGGLAGLINGPVLIWLLRKPKVVK